MTNTKFPGIYLSLLHLIFIATSATILFTNPFEAPKPSRNSFFLWLLWISPDVYPPIYLIGTRKRSPPDPSEAPLHAIAEIFSDILSDTITIFNIGQVWLFTVKGFIWEHLGQFDPSDFSIVFLWLFAILWTSLFSMVVLVLVVLVVMRVSKTSRGERWKEGSKEEDLEGSGHAEELLPVAGGVDDIESLVKDEGE